MRPSARSLRAKGHPCQPSGLSLRVKLALLPSLGLASCTFELVSRFEITEPLLVGVRVRVVELAPIWPSRVGPDPNRVEPIAEPLSGDRVRVEALVVEVDGTLRPTEQIDALWFMCGLEGCTDGSFDLLPELDTPCASLDDWTLESTCALGGGGALELEVPPAGDAEIPELVALQLYVVVAREPDVRAEDCLRWRTTRDRQLEGCGFRRHVVSLGPYGPLADQIVQAGGSIEVPLDEIPAAAYLEPASREPVLEQVELTIAGQTTLVPVAGPPIPLRRGTSLRLNVDEELVDPSKREVDIGPRQAEQSYVFVPYPELAYYDFYVTEPLRRLDDPGLFALRRTSAQIEVDAEAELGPARIVIIYGDEAGAQTMTWIDVDVQP